MQRLCLVKIDDFSCQIRVVNLDLENLKKNLRKPLCWVKPGKQQLPSTWIPYLQYVREPSAPFKKDTSGNDLGKKVLTLRTASSRSNQLTESQFMSGKRSEGQYFTKRREI